LAELEEINVPNPSKDFSAMMYDVIDPVGLDSSSMTALKMSPSKVELLFIWIQILISDAVAKKVIQPPPPMFAGAWSLLSKGLQSFNEALRISFIPFPFPYAQTVDVLLLLHWAMTPLISFSWVPLISWAGLLTFMQVFIVQALNAIACEIENPFGIDANDLDSDVLQDEMNGHLLLLLQNCVRQPPELVANACRDFSDPLLVTRLPLHIAFQDLDGDEAPVARSSFMRPSCSATKDLGKPSRRTSAPLSALRSQAFGEPAACPKVTTGNGHHAQDYIGPHNKQMLI
jgi:hypothetical protein